jgi:hypothetical protein
VLHLGIGLSYQLFSLVADTASLLDKGRGFRIDPHNRLNGYGFSAAGLAYDSQSLILIQIKTYSPDGMDFPLIGGKGYLQVFYF